MPWYQRYMDDITLASDDAGQLIEARERIGPKARGRMPEHLGAAVDDLGSWRQRPSGSCGSPVGCC